MIKDINSRLLPNEKYKIVCSTVHSFQGSEQDIIIYEVPNCYTNQCPSILITNNTNQIADRLFNVAMTRAKGKFINLLNYEYMHNHMNGPSDKQKVSVQFFNQMMTVHKRIDYTEIFTDKSSEPISFIQPGTGADELFLMDLKSAKDKIKLYITDDMKADFVSAANDCKVLFRPVIRFMGNNTAQKIIGLMKSL